MGDCTLENLLLSPEGDDCWDLRTQHITGTGVSSHDAAMLQPYSQGGCAFTERFMFASYCIHFAMYEGREIVVHAGHGMVL